MKKKSRILKLKKFTIASLRTQYHIVGAGQTNDPTCEVTVDPNVCATVNKDLCKTNLPNTSCLSSNTEPISNARGSCAPIIDDTYSTL